jgi:hypothetical protein
MKRQEVRAFGLSIIMEIPIQASVAGSSYTNVAQEIFSVIGEIVILDKAWTASGGRFVLWTEENRQFRLYDNPYFLANTPYSRLFCVLSFFYRSYQAF